MNRNTLPLIIISLFLVPTIASWRPLPLLERVQKSDAIAIVTITKVHPMTNGVYRSVALAKIEQPLKGVEDMNSIQLLFDKEPMVEGQNPHYARGDYCLLFLAEISHGKYDLLQSVFDKHPIKDGEIEDTDGEHGLQKVALTNFVNQITILLSQNKKHRIRKINTLKIPYELALV